MNFIKKAILLLLAIMLCSCSSKSAPAPEPSASPIEEEDVLELAKPDESINYEVLSADAAIWKSIVGTVWIQAVAEIKNIGDAPLYLSSGDIDIHDEKGSLVEVVKTASVYPQVIKPGETAIYCGTTTSESISEDAAVKLSPHINAKDANVDQILFPSSDIDISDGDHGGVEATGRLKNTAQNESDMIYAVVICRGEDGKVLAALMDIVSAKAGETVSFSATSLSLPASVSASSIASYNAYAYPMQIQF